MSRASSRATKVVFHPAKPKQKVLVSPGHGAGWVTWAGDQFILNGGPPANFDEFLAWMITYEPLITFIEDHHSTTAGVARERRDSKNDTAAAAAAAAAAVAVAPPTVMMDETSRRVTRDEILRQFDREAEAKFGITDVHHRGSHQLKVREVDGPFYLSEYDGYERVVRMDEWRNVQLGGR